MIRCALACSDCSHEFEAWFASSAAFDRLQSDDALECPRCGGSHVSKQIMAPSVARRDGARRDPDREAFEAFAAKAREHVASTHEYVGDGFADEARAMFYGEKDEKPIWGETTPEERKALKDEGIPAAPLPKPFVPPVPKDKSKLS